MLFNCRGLLRLLIAGLLVSGCASAPSQPPAANQTDPTTPPTRSQSDATPTAAAPLPTATSAAVSGGLPAPVYALSAQAGTAQIWRIEVDGTTTAQITNEPGPILHFDVSPTDGRLAFVSDNDLIITDAQGQGRTVLFDGPERAVEDVGVSPPLWSPDGQSIAFSAGGGVQVIAAGGGEPRELLPNVPASAAFPGTVYEILYQPAAWSPDGKRLVLNYIYGVGDGGGIMVLTIADLSVVRVPSATGCCHPVWSPDGASIYADNMLIMPTPGLWRVDSATGAPETLLGGPTADQQRQVLVYQVHPLPDGEIRAFVQETDVRDVSGVSNPLQMSAIKLAGSQVTITPLRTDTYKLHGVLWAPDGRGAVIIQYLEAPTYPGPSVAQTEGPLLWLSATNQPPLALALEGSSPRWGQR